MRETVMRWNPLLLAVFVNAGGCADEREPSGFYEGAFFAEADGERVGSGPSDRTTVTSEWDGSRLVVRIEVDRTHITLHGNESVAVGLTFLPGVRVGEPLEFGGQAVLRDVTGCEPTVDYVGTVPSSPITSAAAWEEDYYACEDGMAETTQHLTGEVTITAVAADRLAGRMDLVAAPIHASHYSQLSGLDVRFYGDF